MDGVLCSECSDSEWRSQEAHAEAGCSTSSVKWLAFMLHIVLELVASPKDKPISKTVYACRTQLCMSCSAYNVIKGAVPLKTGGFYLNIL